MILDGADQPTLREGIDRLLEHRAEDAGNPIGVGNGLRMLMREVRDQVTLTFPAIADFLPLSFLDIGTGDSAYLVRSCRERLLRLARIASWARLTQNEKAREMCRYIVSHVDEDISLHQMAEQFYMNERYLSGFFHKQTGLTFRGFCTQVRIERAKKLLSDGDKRVYEIAQILNFKDVEYFSRVFRQHVGATPSNYVWSPEDDLPLYSAPAKKVAQKGDIRVGVLGNYTGAYDYLDGGKRQLYQLAADEINQADGICGRKLALTYVDLASDLSLVEDKTQGLINSGVDLLIGGFLSSAREIIRKVVDTNQVLYFYDSLYEGGLADHYTFTFASMPEQNLDPAIEHLMRQARRRFYILATDYNYGILSCEYAKHRIEGLGGEVVATEYVPLQKEGFSVTIENINELQPDAIIAFLVGERQNSFFQQLHSGTCGKIPVISTSAIPQEHLHLSAPKGTLQNLYFCAPYTQELGTTESAAWREKVRARYDTSQIPYLGSDQEAAYISLFFYRAAVEQCGSTEVEDVIHALESGLSLETPGGPATINGADHQLIRTVGVYRVDADNKVQELQLVPSVKPTFVQEILWHQYHVRGGLRELGRRSPNIQYNAMFYRV
jgi:branched-chain amino acid transport system substrate-binding protein